MLALPVPTGLCRTVKQQCSYRRSSCNINPHIIHRSSFRRHLSPLKLACRKPRRRSVIIEFSLWAWWAGESVARARRTVPGQMHEQIIPPARVQPHTCSEVHAAPASPHSHTKPGACTVRTWHSRLRCELVTYAVTILEICIKKEVWSSLIEHAGGGIMHV